MADTLTAVESVSPLAHLAAELERASSDPVRIREVPFRSQLLVRASAEGAARSAIADALRLPLPVQPNTISRHDDLRVLWLGPAEWLVVAPDGEADRLEKAVRGALADDFGSVVDVSAHRTTLLCTGPEVPDLLAGGCALDLDAEVFTDRQCAQTMVAKAPVLLHREDGGFAVAVRASFADYLARWLIDAMSDVPGRR